MLQYIINQKLDFLEILKRILFTCIIFLTSTISFSQTLGFTENNLGQLSASSSQFTYAKWVDIDNDGDLDIYYAFSSGIGILRNNGTGSFSQETINSSLWATYSVWSDYDSDGDLDLFVRHKIFNNDGTGSFTEIDNPFIDRSDDVFGMDLGDLDHDGDLDALCLMQEGGSDGLYARVFYNNNGDYIKSVHEIQIPGLTYAMCELVDLDQDSWLDIVYFNRDSLWIYQYNHPEFDLHSVLPGSGYVGLEININDIDNDNDPDLIACGSILNNDFPSFSKMPRLGSYFPEMIETGDVDSDGDIDILYLINNQEAILFLNDGGAYSESGITFPVFQISNGDFGDYDQDGDLDLLVIFNQGGKVYASIMENTLNTVNSAPLSPVNINANVGLNEVEFTWDASTDTETPSDGLFYNLFLNKGATIIEPSHSDINSGFMRYSKKGNAGQVLSHTIKGLSAGTYTWSVQAIDGGLRASTFPTPEIFIISHSNNIAPLSPQRLLPGVSGTAVSVSESGSFDKRNWAYSVNRGGPYIDLGVSSSSYTPKFSNPGDYYVVCLSILGTDTAISNEIQVIIPYFSETVLVGLADDDLRSVEAVDFDNDGDYDILVTAFDDPVLNILYENNGGVYSIATGFTPPSLISTASTCFDYDNDGLIDIFLCGEITPTEYSSIIYRNTGGLNFVPQVSFIEAQVKSGSADHGDFNNDGLQDIIFCGVNTETEPLTKIYRNNGDGTFSDIEAPIIPVSSGSVDFIDLNNDALVDIFISGNDLSGNPSAKYYLNNGQGEFTLSDFTFRDLEETQTDFGDYNNDGFIDILVTGTHPSGYYTLIYKNINGSDFSEFLLSFYNSTYNSGKWIDYDNDGDLDILMVSDVSARSFNDFNPSNLVIENIGNDQFKNNISLKNQMLIKASSAYCIYSDDTDTDPDFLQLCYDPSTFQRKIVKFENQSQLVKDTPPLPSDMTYIASGDEVYLSWTDNTTPGDPDVTYNITVYDGNKYLQRPMADESNGFRRINEYGEINDTSWVIIGLEAGEYYWKIQTIDNSLNSSAFTDEDTIVLEEPFIYSTEHPFPDLDYGGADWGDFDNDGDLDLLLAGQTDENTRVTKLYRNVSGSLFTEVSSSFTGLSSSHGAITVEWVDLNNDNYLDILLGGTVSESGQRILEIYRNNSGASFTKEYVINGEQIDVTSYGDLDNDGDIDIVAHPFIRLMNDGDFSFTRIHDDKIYTGYLDVVDLDNDFDFDLVTMLGYYSYIYINQGNLNFTEIPNNLPLLAGFGDTKWFDYNNDSYADLLLTGLDNSYFITKIYKNNRDNTFTELNTFFKGSEIGHLAIGDYENDGDSDFFITGYNSLQFNELYLNDQNDKFHNLDFTFSYNGYKGEAKMGDMDGDGDLDIITTGMNDATGNPLTTLYESTKNWHNTPPIPPDTLDYTREGVGIIFEWNKGIDEESGRDGLSYNIRVGTTPGAFDIVAPSSDLSSGFRRIAKKGNAQYNFGYKIDPIPLGTYHWSVQAIDHSFAGGSWSDEQTVVISNINVDFSANEVCEGIETSFADLSVPVGVTISHWDWDFGDGTTSTLQNPSHVFQGSGSNDVKLVVSYMQDMVKIAGDSMTKSISVLPSIDAEFSASTVCEGASTDFYNNSVFNGLTAFSWLWDFNDGQTFSFEDPGTHGYLNPGDYNVSLTVTANNGCVDSIENLVQVGEYPEVAVAANDLLSFCLGDSVTLSVPDDINYDYSWKRNGTLISGADLNNYTAKLSGSYTVEVMNPIGNCSNTSDMKVISVDQYPSTPLVLVKNYEKDACQDEDPIILSVETEEANTVYHWNRNGVPIPGEVNSTFTAFLDEGDYSLVATKGACSIESQILTIQYADMPEKPEIIAEGPVIWYLACSNDSATAYKWYLDGILIGGAEKYLYVAGNLEGKFEVAISQNSSCFAYSSPVWIPLGTGIDVDPWENLKIYPNPTPGIFTLEMDNHIMGELVIDIFGETGSKIINIKFHKETSHFKTQIDLSEQPPAAYMIGMLLDKYRTDRTLIVE